MGRRAKLDKGIHRNVYIPQSILMKVELELHSEVEGKVPYGAWNNLIVDQLRKWLESRGVVV